MAIGGNAILRSNEMGTIDAQLANVKETCKHLAEMVKGGYKIIITHGNGPQVGNILLQNEEARGKVAPMPLDVCVAKTQGQIGYMLQQALKNELIKYDLDNKVISLTTQVVVDGNDPAFDAPTKPIGPFYIKKRADELIRKNGWIMVEDKMRGGFRHVVPSPQPIDIVEKESIKLLVFDKEDKIVIAAGGGGIPVIRTKEGFKGVEAVVDKDLASVLLARIVNATSLIMLTDVEKVAINFGRPDQLDLDKITLDDAIKYLKEGHFPPGSMGPKISAAIQFLEAGGEKVIVTTPNSLKKALKGRTGTHILP